MIACSPWRRVLIEVWKYKDMVLPSLVRAPPSSFQPASSNNFFAPSTSRSQVVFFESTEVGTTKMLQFATPVGPYSFSAMALRSIALLIA